VVIPGDHAAHRVAGHQETVGGEPGGVVEREAAPDAPIEVTGQNRQRCDIDESGGGVQVEREVRHLVVTRDEGGESESGRCLVYDPECTIIPYRELDHDTVIYIYKYE